MAGAILGVAIILAAALILLRRLKQFVRTKGQSACSNCPYAGNCSGGCIKHKP